MYIEPYTCLNSTNILNSYIHYYYNAIFICIHYTYIGDVNRSLSYSMFNYLTRK